MKIVYFGTPQFSARVLAYLIEQGIDVAAVVTRTDKPKGRSGKQVPTPVKEWVLENRPEIPLFQPEKVSSPDFADVLPPFEADLFVFVAYGELVKQHILDMPKTACINLHTSLLPKYRGAAPIQRCIMNGEIETGVTIIHMAMKMDSGNIIRQTKLPIGENDHFGAVEEGLRKLGSKVLLDVIHDFEKGEVPETPQDETKVIFAPKVELEDCEIHWNQDAHSIHNLIRGVNPYPGAWCFVDVKGLKKRLKIKVSSVFDENEGQPGQIISCDETGMRVGTGKGVILIKVLQLEGKKVMTPSELMRGTTFTF